MDARILFVDDKPERFRWFTAELEGLAAHSPGLGLSGADVVYAQSGPEALALLAARPSGILVAVVDLDFSKLPPEKALLGPDPQRDGLDIARAIRRAAPGVRVFIFTMTEAEVTLEDPGVHVVPFDSVLRRDVVSVVLELLVEQRARVEGEARDDDLPPSLRSEPGVGHLRRLARSELSLLILGETGVGKTVLASWIHRASGRRGRMETVDCTRWPAGGDPNFMTAALFGQVKNAFPGAAECRGACELARDGTLFLEEVAELRPELQGTLLRAVEERVIRRLGGFEDTAVAFRLVSATNRPIADLRSDFFHRISAGDPIVLRPLRERPEDIRWLAERTLGRINADRDRGQAEPRMFLDGDTIRALEAHEWPGNARELAAAIRHAAVQADQGVISPAHLPASALARRRARTPAGIAARDAGPGDLAVSVGEPLDSLVRRYLLACWCRSGFDGPRAADLAKVGRSTLWRALRRSAVALMESVLLDGKSLEEAAAPLGLSREAAERLRLDAELYLHKLASSSIDAAAKAVELGVERERLTAILGRLSSP